MSSFIRNKNYSRTIVTVMKDEAPYLLDWVSYHLAIGFTHFVILTNDCSDGTEKIARKLGKLGIVTHKNNPAPHPRGPQKTGYLRMRNLEAVQQAGWLMSLDVDEFLRIDLGDGSLDGLFAVAGDKTKAFSFVWQLFGNNDVIEINEHPIWEQFTRASHPLQSRPYETTSIKTLYQAQYFEKIGTHRPIGFDKDKLDEFLWIDADGVPMVMYYLQRHWRAYENGIGFGTVAGRINHYALRSLDGFMVKWQRGFVHPTAPTVRGKGTALDYWILFNWNNILEPRQLRLLDKAAAIKSELLAFDNINQLYQKGYDWHQNRAKELKTENMEIYEKLNAQGSTQIDGQLPDFSQYGSPKSSNQRYVPIVHLMNKAKIHSIFNFEIIQKNYEAINQI